MPRPIGVSGAVLLIGVACTAKVTSLPVERFRPKAVAPLIPQSSPRPAPSVAPVLPSVAEAGAPETDPLALPPGFVSFPAEGETQETRCGDFSIAFLPEPKTSDVQFVRVKKPDGQIAYEAHGQLDRFDSASLRQSLYGEFCGDLDADGVPELVMTERSFGAHCCYTHYVVSLSSPPKRILKWPKGDAGTAFRPVKYGPGPAFQLQGWVVFWPPFENDQEAPVLSYATAPVIPAVFAWLGGKLRLTSLSFPEAYRKDRQDEKVRCTDPKAECDEDLENIYDWVDSVAIGDWETRREKVKNPSLRAVLDRLAAPTRRALEQQLGTLEAPVELSPRKPPK